MTCAKQKVTCIIVARDGRRFVGENSCRKPQDVCPREPGEGYAKCNVICEKDGHAEAMALFRAGEAARGATAYIIGHTRVCENCQILLANAGVSHFVIGTPPEERPMEPTYLITDTETTGFPRKGGPIQEGQARVCQLALIYADANGKTLAEFNTLIKPDGWTISEGAGKVHGITDEQCAAYGIPAGEAFAIFQRFAGMATTIMAHGEEFDRSMLDIEKAYALGIDAWMPYSPWHCTMKSNAHYFGKNPKLEHALEFFTGRKLGENAHNAKFDVEACRDIFFAERMKSTQSEA